MAVPLIMPGADRSDLVTKTIILGTATNLGYSPLAHYGISRSWTKASCGIQF
ncbi:hypothetical protein [Pelagibacterium sp.]|uniref:hypothetical protein n=1 Tax=Pelagibacterium sp. TaxID=1967288 RepID=UPI003A8DACF6